MPSRSAISARKPHPAGIGVVGTYVHAYDPSSRAPYTHPIPGMRPSYEPATAHLTDHGSATPIYDALYAEYRRSFRALPGDRTDEPEISEALHASRNWSRTTESAAPLGGRGPAALPPAGPCPGGAAPGTAGRPAARPLSGPYGPGARRYFFLLRFSRTRTEMWIGVPSKLNSSRSRRSTKRR